MANPLYAIPNFKVSRYLFNRKPAFFCQYFGPFGYTFLHQLSRICAYLLPSSGILVLALITYDVIITYFNSWIAKTTARRQAQIEPGFLPAHFYQTAIVSY